MKIDFKYLFKINYGTMTDKITLENIDIFKLNKLYSLGVLPIKEELIKPQTTKLNIFVDLPDEIKKMRKCIATMMDENNQILSEKTTKCCWWCRNKFDSYPIGCPIKYIPSSSIKAYKSEITKNMYSIKENISKSTRKRNEDDGKSSNNIKMKINKNEYYIVEGIFCSFNCCLAYINDNKKQSSLQHSHFLLQKLYNDITEKNNTINPAPSWKLLQDYGGNMSIKEFRDSFNVIEYTEIAKLKEIPIQKTIKNIFEEKKKLL